MKRKICLSLWSLEDLTFRHGKTLFDLLEICADLGVDGVDIGEDYHGWPPYDTVHGLNLIRKKAHSLGLQILSSWIYTDSVAAVATSSVNEVVWQISDMLAKCNLLECPFIAPDFEAWRFATEDLPLCHVEAPGSVTPSPTSLEVFRRCMPYSPLIHAKMLGFDANGDEPHMPMSEMLKIIRESPVPYIIDIEYEGWIPDIRPDIDSVAASAKAIALLRRYLD